ncbi:MAG: glycosyltransferase family 4 protein [Bacteroidota bacterium]
MREKQKRILLVGDYMDGTGFNRVVNHFKKAVTPHFEVHHVGINYRGESFLDEDGVMIYPQMTKNGGHLGYKNIGRLIEKIEPDIFFVIFDLIFIRFILEALRYRKKPLIVGAYVALDGLITKHRKMLSPLKALDFCVLYTNFAYNHIQEILLKSPSTLRKKVDFRIIPHGVETDIFYPLNSKLNTQKVDVRRKVFPELQDVENAFIVFNGNRPVPRKRLDITLKAFALFVKDKPSNVKLYLHNTFLGGLPANDIQDLINQLNIKDRILKGPLKKGQGIVDNETLNLIYNACDVGMNTCMGEGWGLVNCEHGATAKPQILPKHTAFPEIWEQAVSWVDYKTTTPVNYSPHHMYLIDPVEVASSLERLYKDDKYYAEQSTAAYQQMTNDRFSWKNIEKKWEKLFLSFYKD